jgi:hypothetical protein
MRMVTPGRKRNSCPHFRFSPAHTKALLHLSIHFHPIWDASLTIGVQNALVAIRGPAALVPRRA